MSIPSSPTATQQPYLLFIVEDATAFHSPRWGDLLAEETSVFDPNGLIGDSDTIV